MRRYLCERCGGSGVEPAGHWVRSSHAWDSVVGGPCTCCQGTGRLGYILNGLLIHLGDEEMDQDTIDFGDPNRRKKFQESYLRARREGLESFVFLGREVLVDYAYYMLEHLANVTKDESLRPEKREGH